MKEKRKSQREHSLALSLSESPEVKQIIESQVAEQIERIQLSVETTEFHSGPLPTPGTLQQYGDVLAEAPERILRMAEIEQQSRIRYSDRRLDYVARDNRNGQILGFVLGLFGIGCGTYLISTGRDLGGFTLFLGSLGALIGTAFWKHKSKKVAVEKKIEKKD